MNAEGETFRHGFQSLLAAARKRDFRLPTEVNDRGSDGRQIEPAVLNLVRLAPFYREREADRWGRLDRRFDDRALEKLTATVAVEVQHRFDNRFERKDEPSRFLDREHRHAREAYDITRRTQMTLMVLDRFAQE